MNKKILEFYWGAQYTPDPVLFVVRVHHLIKWTIIVCTLWLCQGCNVSRQSNGEEFRAMQVWHPITAKDTALPPVILGRWAFLPGTIEYIIWKRMDSLDKRLQRIENTLFLPIDTTFLHHTKPNERGN